MCVGCVCGLCVRGEGERECRARPAPPELTAASTAKLAPLRTPAAIAHQTAITKGEQRGEREAPARPRRSRGPSRRGSAPPRAKTGPNQPRNQSIQTT